MVRSRGGASGSRGVGGRTIGRIEGTGSSRLVGPSDDDGLGRVFRRRGEAGAGDASAMVPVGVASRKGTGNSAFEGLSDLGVEMSLEMVAEEALDAEEEEVRTLLAEAEVA